MRFLYPQSVLSPKKPDELFKEEVEAVAQRGIPVSLFDSEVLENKLVAFKPKVEIEETTIYRGWMLTAAEYENLAQSVSGVGGKPLISAVQYLAAHHLPNWYKLLSDLTPETVVLPLEADWEKELTALGWPKFFVKDYVKSLKTSVGAIIERPEDIHVVCAEMEKYRGRIEGGLCIRRVEEFIQETEQRYFVINGKPYAADAQHDIPTAVSACAERIESPFFSVDIVTRTDGVSRIIEIGDGQVSDLVGWTVARFASIWQEII
ncbi:MAG TPA: ATP-grasp domain-containing protein [Blastocatellia bacterium]|nr:ATP-grasp domain-containing protein [Blastocatellia bacterium]HMV84140.1 ATP-grasp domain-containing protein [Blastocatellia bacterium]HMX25275.1 ATP-grasp domain-containing protein [Blastocatellia bacterium]HMY73691.1 ATP-grasp domain-containing protein [Blastocatellia bacterium]HMZ19868.1 ATP-grasp domain-containing protein [Blastocatellia bacterium]